MRNYLLSLLILMNVSFSQEITIAVFDFENNGLRYSEVRILTDRLQSELVKIGGYKVVERQKIDKVFEEQKHEFYENTQKQLYTEMTSDGLPEGGDSQAVLDSHKLAEEIVDNKEEKYIFESPDGGETVFKRKFGSDKRELVKDWKAISE